MAEPFLGEIRMFGFNFTPQGWAACDGQLLPINQFTALFSLLGTIYGGNGVTNFALPDLRGRVPLQAGQGPGLSNYIQGQPGGQEAVQLITAEMPAHIHGVAPGANSGAGTSRDATGNFPAKEAAGQTEVYAPTADTTMAHSNTDVAGAGVAHANIQPYLTLNFCMALAGIFPSRS